MRIDVWSDVVCPWCYIGKRRLESALASFGHKDDVEVVWHSFQLDPSAPREATGETVAAHLGAKYGMGEEQAREMQQRVIDLAAAEGMTWDHHNSPYVNTVDAHRLIHLADHLGGHERSAALKERLLEAYFVHARNVADHAVLTELALAEGLPADRVAEVLASTEFEDEVAADQAQAQAYGATGVPFFVIDDKYGISGAQPAELFSQAIGQAWTESHPVLNLVGGQADGECGPDGCAI
ncbi:DsbA family oxidoreductase [Nocardioides sp. Kera G14]|uniref:DsbA family oxidoreductase n=1 Tax=Nocardioides sp. Kera G14 TaxID=2884264 RepID=UPI001D11D0F8|nr:DsbA family oxidoreductase [Nocardioides sp. Kera G14]UDY22722.1 DsbA family oxidoreductase [Nocardioides sp. Kera G14]